MTTRKRNEWLDTGASDDEDEQGYNSEEEQESRGALAGRSQKRRRVEQEDNSDDDSVDDDQSEDDGASKAKATSSTRFDLVDEDQDDELPSDLEDAQDGDEDLDEGNNEESATLSKQKDSKLKPLTAKQLEKSQKAAKKTGVIYLSRIPPFMKPATLKHLLSAYGEIGRIFLTPEDPTAHQRRVRAGGNKKKSFTDGWVEFISKKNAKLVAETLNGNIVGGKKGSFYHDDVWNMKYLKGFKWHHLTDQIANENAERAARLRAEISKTRRENKKFVEDIERAKMLETMASKKMARMEKEGLAAGGEASASVKPFETRGPKMQFKQNLVKSKRVKDGAKAEQPDAIQRAVQNIF